MAKGKSAAPAKVRTGDSRPNGKAFKKNPGPAQPPKTNFDHIKGRSSTSYLKREAWKAAGGRYMHESIPHWKTGLIWDKEANVFRLPGKSNE
jgi:hypothetical protein